MSMADSKRKASAEAGPPAKKIKGEHGKAGVHPDRQRFQKDGTGKPNGSKKEDNGESVLNGIPTLVPRGMALY